MKQYYTIIRVNLIIVAIIIVTIISLLITENIIHNRPMKSSGAMQSLQWMSEIRAFPDKDIPSDAYYKAYEYSMKHLANTIDNDAPDSWQ
ncbi:MAG: hypothetical protein N2490_03870, partial [Ignavibacteria bacterium]|nr:hypothetical protein [Ignavibacteria bacterium]